MNCADSVLNSDELPVRGIDQCPSTLSTQWSPGLVLVKWNRLLALFKRARLYSCFVEAEAFLKCVNLYGSKESYFPPLFIQAIDIVCPCFGPSRFVRVLLFAALELCVLTLKFETVFFFSFNWLLKLSKPTRYNSKASSEKRRPPSTHSLASQTCLRCVCVCFVG